MVQINLNEFSTYDWSQLLEFIRLQDEEEFTITLPKKTVEITDCNFNIFWEYYHAAYVGQELAKISSHFSYTVPCTKRPFHFAFQVVVKDKYLLAITLFYLINGLYAQEDKFLGDQYNTAAAKLLEDAFNGKEDTACWGLIWLANIFLIKS